MKKLSFLCSTVVFGLGLTVSLAGCAARAPRVPIHADPQLASLRMDTIHLLPAVDRRVDRSSVIDLEGSIRNRALSALMRKGYSVVTPAGFSESRAYPNDEVAEMEARELAALGPEDAEFLFIISLDDASGKTALGYSFKAEVTGMLVSRQTGALLWRDRGIATEGQGGLIGCAMSGWIRSEALGSCVGTMMETFPMHADRR